MGRFHHFWQAGHWPSLVGSFLYFDLSFMAWMMLGAVSAFISEDFSLSATEKGVLVSLPILGGSLFRILFGLLTDRIGPRKTAIIGMLFTLLPLFLLWVSGRTLPELYAYGFLLGIAGASFAAALPLASRWYPPQYQGLVMGITGAGNSGTLLATLFAPKIATALGDWHLVFGLSMIPVTFTLLTYLFMVKEPSRAEVQSGLLLHSRTLLRQRDAWLLCYFYSITFGGFVGMTSFMPLFLHDHYGLDKVTAGYWVTLCVLSGSLFRPLGGWISDKIGGLRLLNGLFAVITILFAVHSLLFSFNWEILVLLLTMIAFGLGNGAVFQLVPLRFKDEIGTMTGLVGAAGGIGGFLLPSLLGSMKDMTGSFTTGFLLLAIISAGGLWAGHLMKRGLQQTTHFDQSTPLQQDGMMSSEPLS
jgi:MFS transporter, NNP family, nitrate/nitrite transporter